MSKRSNVATTLIAGIALIASVVFLISFGKPDRSSALENDVLPLGSLETVPPATVTVPPLGTVTIVAPATVVPLITSTVIYQGTPITVVNRRHILAGKSPEEIGQYAVEKVAPSYLGPEGPIQVRLARPVTREEVPNLGLGCLPDNSGYEEPPFVLVILQGSFDLTGIPRPVELPGTTERHYVAVIIDVWAAAPTSIIASADGSRFREILNDPSLPQPAPQNPRNCPPRTPGTYPHGVVLPGIAFPTSLPEPTSTPEVVPPPIPTQSP